MDAKRRLREEKKRELLRQLAELAVEEQTEEGVFRQTPHWSQIEEAARELGQQLSCQVQQRASREVAARCAAEVNCPQCGRLCPTETDKRTVTSLDGPVELLEVKAYCRRCRRHFFPSAGSVGVRQPGTDSGGQSGGGVRSG